MMSSIRPQGIGGYPTPTMDHMRSRMWRMASKDSEWTIWAAGRRGPHCGTVWRGSTDSPIADSRFEGSDQVGVGGS